MSKHDLIVAAGKFLVAGRDDDPTSVSEYKLDGVRDDCYLGSNDKYKDQMMYKDYCWPVQVRDELISVLTERNKLMKAYNESMGLIYELNNKIARGEVAPEVKA